MASASVQPVAESLPDRLIDDLWQESEAAVCGLSREEWAALLLRAGERTGFGLGAGAAVSNDRKGTYLRSLKLTDYALAQACALGREQAWERFLALYRSPLTRAAVAITGSETVGRDVADALYAELYGLNVRDGARRSPLASYAGRGSLMGWLRTTLAQRHVDRHRQTHRETPLGDYDAPAPPGEKTPAHAPVELTALGKAIAQALQARTAEERLLLASYYLDERTLLQIARVLQVHEATVSRKLHRLLDELRKQVLRELQRGGMSRRTAEEALGADPRDLDLNLKKLLQGSSAKTFQGTSQYAVKETSGR